MCPDAIADEALLTVSRWQRMTPQMHADHMLRVWQSRRHLKPIYRFVDSPPLAPENDNTSLADLDRVNAAVAIEVQS